MKQFAFLFFIGAMLIFSSCGRVEGDLQGDTFEVEEFFPLGKYEWTYRADSVIYDLVGNEQILDSTTSFIRYRMEMVEGEWLLTESGRPDTSSAWKVTGSTQIRVENGSVVLNRSGQSLIALKNPIREGTNWEESALVDPNLTIIVSGESVAPFSIPWQAEYTQIIEGFELGDIIFDRVAKKVSVDEDVLIERRHHVEWYAAGYGLIQAQGFIADTQCEHISGELADCIEVPWHRKAAKGFQYFLTLESYETW